MKDVSSLGVGGGSVCACVRCSVLFDRFYNYNAILCSRADSLCTLAACESKGVLCDCVCVCVRACVVRFDHQSIPSIPVFV